MPRDIEPGVPSPSRHGALLAAAAHEFLRGGYTATSLQRVADRGHVSKTTVHYRLGRKAATFAAAMAYYYNDLAVSVEDAWQGPGTLYDRLHRVMTVGVRSVRCRLQASAVVQEAWSALHDAERVQITTARQALDDALGAVVQAMHPDWPAEQRIFGSFALMALWSLPGVADPAGTLMFPDEADTVERLARMVIHGVAPEPP